MNSSVCFTWWDRRKYCDSTGVDPSSQQAMRPVKLDTAEALILTLIFIGLAVVYDLLCEEQFMPGS